MVPEREETQMMLSQQIQSSQFRYLGWIGLKVKPSLGDISIRPKCFEIQPTGQNSMLKGIIIKPGGCYEIHE